MKIDLKIKKCPISVAHHEIKLRINDEHCDFQLLTLDAVEDLEINLTDLIKQLQDYRLAQPEGDTNECQHEQHFDIHNTNVSKKCIKCGELYK